MEFLDGNNGISNIQRTIEKTSSENNGYQIFLVDAQQIILADTNKKNLGRFYKSDLMQKSIKSNLQTSEYKDNHHILITPLNGQITSKLFSDIPAMLIVDIDFNPEIRKLQLTFEIIALSGFFISIIIFMFQYILVKKLLIDRIELVENNLTHYLHEGNPKRIISNPISYAKDEIDLLVNTYNVLVNSLENSKNNLQTERDFAFLVMESMGEGLTITNAEGVFEYVNPAYARLLGITPENIIGKSPLDFTHIDDHIINHEAWEIRHEGKASAYEIRLIDHDGNDVNVLISSVPRITNGKFTGSIAVITNISQRLHLEQMKTDFINRASHELRTPLSTSILMVNLLEDYVSGEQKEYLEVLKQELNHQRLMVNDLLVESRIESKKYEVHLAKINFESTFDEALASVQPQVESKAIRVTYDHKELIPEIISDRQALIQVFQNLLTNALKFSKPGSPIDVTISYFFENIRIQVQDYGIGIPARDLPYISKRFFRAQNATELEIQGTGIGLHIVQEILNSLNGSMEISSSENIGTNITILLPTNI